MLDKRYSHFFRTFYKLDHANKLAYYLPTVSYVIKRKGDNTDEKFLKEITDEIDNKEGKPSVDYDKIVDKYSDGLDTCEKLGGSHPSTIRFNYDSLNDIVDVIDRVCLIGCMIDLYIRANGEVYKVVRENNIKRIK